MTTKQEAAHTAIPWRIEQWPFDPEFPAGGVRIYGPDLESSQWVADCGVSDDAERIANAEFLVRACNSFGQLMAACRAFADWLDNADHPKGGSLTEPARLCRAALQLAERGTE